MWNERSIKDSSDTPFSIQTWTDSKLNMFAKLVRRINSVIVCSLLNFFPAVHPCVYRPDLWDPGRSPAQMQNSLRDEIHHHLRGEVWTRLLWGVWRILRRKMWGDLWDSMHWIRRWEVVSRATRDRVQKSARRVHDVCRREMYPDACPNLNQGAKTNMWRETKELCFRNFLLINRIN